LTPGRLGTLIAFSGLAALALTVWSLHDGPAVAFLFSLSFSDQAYKNAEEISMLAKLVRTVVAVTTVCGITWGGNAHAEILITTAAISGGELVIVGRVRRPRDPGVQIKINPSKTVQVESTATGGFRWIGPEFPSTCKIEIASGEEKREVLIQNCGPAEPPGPPGPAGPPGQTGPAGPKGDPGEAAK
jgi:hypothetical protein